MSRRGIRLVFAVVVAAIVVAAVAVERMTAASAQVGMQRAPARRVPLPTVPTRKLVTVRAAEGGAARTTGGAAQESTDPPPTLLSRSTLTRLTGGAVGDVWLDLYPRRPSVPNKGHLRWTEGRAFVTTAANHPNGYLRFLMQGTGGAGDGPAAMVHVRPQVDGARYLVDCSVQVYDSSVPLTVAFRGHKYVVSPVNGHLVFIWEIPAGGNTRVTERNNYVTISSPDTDWTFYRCQLTFLGGPET